MSAALLELGRCRVERVAAANERFFDDFVDTLVAASRDMAQRFRDGGRLFVHGSGASATDANHVAVEFLHPVIVGQPALPAIAVSDNGAPALAGALRSHDILLQIDCGDSGELLATGGKSEILTIRLSGADAITTSNHPDHLLIVPDEDPTIVQEVQETACHVLHELTHLFLKSELRA